MAVERDVPRLGCGEPIDAIWASIGHPASAHQAQCTQCQAARESLLRLSHATEALRDADLRDPRLEPRPDVTAAVMAVARSEVRRGRTIRFRNAPGGAISISEQAICAVIREAVGTVPGVRARRCHIEVAADTDTNADSGRTGNRTAWLDVDLRVVAAAGTLTPARINSLRHTVTETLLARFGVAGGAINITVEDLYDG